MDVVIVYFIVPEALLNDSSNKLNGYIQLFLATSNCIRLYGFYSFIFILIENNLIITYNFSRSSLSL